MFCKNKFTLSCSYYGIEIGRARFLFYLCICLGVSRLGGFGFLRLGGFSFFCVLQSGENSLYIMVDHTYDVFIGASGMARD